MSFETFQVILFLVVSIVALGFVLCMYFWVHSYRKLPKSCPCSDLVLMLRYLDPNEHLTHSEKERVKFLLSKARSSPTVFSLSEGAVKNAGVNPTPSTTKPDLPPPAQRPLNATDAQVSALTTGTPEGIDKLNGELLTLLKQSHSASQAQAVSDAKLANTLNVEAKALTDQMNAPYAGSDILANQQREPTEGDICSECREGTLVVSRDGDCSCHVTAPCIACTSSVLRCNRCSHKF